MKIATLESVTKIVNKIQSLYIRKSKFVVLTQEEYDRLGTKNEDTYYFIKEG